MKKSKKKKGRDQQIVIINNISPAESPGENLRSINLYGDITETKAADIVSSLLYLENTSQTSAPANSQDPDSDQTLVSRDIKLFLSTHGGAASEMFSILDVIAMIQRNTCDIETIGIGKVMSAGVLILAAGTPGKRKVGKNCRIMLHNVMGGYTGTILTMENELEEIKWVQDRYIDCLVKHTRLTKSKVKKLLKTQKDVYISSEDAIKYGIADEII